MHACIYIYILSPAAIAVPYAMSAVLAGAAVNIYIYIFTSLNLSIYLCIFIYLSIYASANLLRT